MQELQALLDQAMEFVNANTWLSMGGVAVLALLFGWIFGAVGGGGKVKRARGERDVIKAELDQAKSQIDELFAANSRLESGDTSGGDETLNAELANRDSTIKSLGDDLARARAELEQLRGNRPPISVSTTGTMTATAKPAIKSGAINTPVATPPKKTIRPFAALSTAAPSVISGLASGSVVTDTPVSNGATTPEPVTPAPAPESAPAPAPEPDVTEAATEPAVNGADTEVAPAGDNSLVWRNRYLESRIRVLESQLAEAATAAPAPEAENSEDTEATEAGATEAGAETIVAADPAPVDMDQPSIEQELAKLRWRTRFLEGRLAYLVGSETTEAEVEPEAAAPALEDTTPEVVAIAEAEPDLIEEAEPEAETAEVADPVIEDVATDHEVSEESTSEAADFSEDTSVEETVVETDAQEPDQIAVEHVPAESDESAAEEAVAFEDTEEVVSAAEEDEPTDEVIPEEDVAEIETVDDETSEEIVESEAELASVTLAEEPAEEVSEPAEAPEEQVDADLEAAPQEESLEGGAGPFTALSTEPQSIDELVETIEQTEEAPVEGDAVAEEGVAAESDPSEADTPVNPTLTHVAPPAIDMPESGGDELTAIEGIGPRIGDALRELGIYTFTQIAEWTPENAGWINHRLGFQGRVEREGWIDQAKAKIADAQSVGA